MSRYLVTGATGFLGRHLVSHLTAQGHDVVALCRSAPRTGVEASPEDLPERTTVAVGDILRKGDVLAAATGCEGVFHCAGKVSRRPEDTESLYRANVEGTEIVLDACVEAGVKRAVMVSTSGTICVSKKAEERDETAKTPMDLIGQWPYYRSKLYAEKAALDRNRTAPADKRLEVVVVNPSLLLGPGDLHGSSTGDVVRFLEKKVPFVPAGGLSFVDARDVAPAMLAAMLSGKPGDRYLLSGANMTVAAFFARLERISGVPAPKLPAPKSMLLARYGAELFDLARKIIPVDADVDPVSAEMGQVFWYVNSRKAERDLGFSPRDPNETLGDTVRDLYDRGIVWP